MIGVTCLLRTRESKLTTSAVEDQFETFKVQYKKVYSSSAESLLRLAVFKANLAVIEAENAKQLPYTLAINEFADLTALEFKAYHFGLNGASSAHEVWSGIASVGTV